MKTYAPSSTNSFAVASPIPSVPPVMTATLPSSFFAIAFSFVAELKPASYLTVVEPLPNVRNRILIERLVKPLRDIADVRCCQDVVQRPKGVIRRQRLNIEYVDRCAGDLLVLQDADQSLFFDDWPARRIDQPRRRLHSRQLRGANQAARSAAQHKMDRQYIGLIEQLV